SPHHCPPRGRRAATPRRREPSWPRVRSRRCSRRGDGGAGCADGARSGAGALAEDTVEMRDGREADALGDLPDRLIRLHEQTPRLVDPQIGDVGDHRGAGVAPELPGEVMPADEELVSEIRELDVLAVV